ncbi:MAG: NUDIX domain-containing protein [Woeseiaceae bacterium]|nr:NUDIX domain-containing protein [Woeseiaceae bacterium]NIP19864.1 NUDIX domain-containing protein [Woeseiaceae bacterium]NIS88665.1 NUDIX domain-containing protein [Woeseiaceae bacterium]
MYPTDLTVSAVIENNGRYLLVEEYSMGDVVINQPGGHIEAGESPEEAIIREVREETGCDVSPGEIIGVYLWIHPQTRQQFLRLVFVAQYVGCDESRPIDSNIVRTRWMARPDIEVRRTDLRTPVVLRCIHDYESGKRQSDSLLTGMLPLQNNVDAVLANADLV